MTSFAKKAAVSMFAGAALVAGAGAAAAPASADPVQDGLVNVAIGDIIIQDINVNVAAQVAAAVCGLKVGPVMVLARGVDRGGDPVTVCDIDQGPIGFVNN